MRISYWSADVCSSDLEQSTIDAAIIAEEFGRAVVVEPFFRSAFLVANLVFEAAEPALADNILARIGSGEGRFAAALYEPDGRFRPEVVTNRAEPAGEGWTRSGRKALRSEERRVGKACVAKCRLRGTPYH